MATGTVRDPHPSPRAPLWRDVLIGSMVCGASVGAVFSNLGDEGFPAGFSFGALAWGLAAMICLFGLPAGLILVFWDRRKGRTVGWKPVLIVPLMILVGFVILFGVVTAPLVINGWARSTSEWLTGSPDNTHARMAAGAVIGVLLGILAVPVMWFSGKLRQWATGPAPEQAKEKAAPGPSLPSDEPQ